MSQVPEQCLKYPGLGHCFKQCSCECYDVIPASDPEEDDDIVEHETCVCGHREHDVLGLDTRTVQTAGAGLVPWNYVHFAADPRLNGASASTLERAAQTAPPQKEQTGPTRPPEKAQCPICMETKPLYKLQVCGHEFCAPCRGRPRDGNRHEYASNRCSLCTQENVTRPGQERGWGLGTK